MIAFFVSNLALSLVFRLVLACQVGIIIVYLTCYQYQHDIRREVTPSKTINVSNSAIVMLDDLKIVWVVFQKCRTTVNANEIMSRMKQVNRVFQTCRLLDRRGPIGVHLLQWPFNQSCRIIRCLVRSKHNDHRARVMHRIPLHTWLNKSNHSCCDFGSILWRKKRLSWRDPWPWWFNGNQTWRRAHLDFMTWISLSNAQTNMSSQLHYNVIKPCHALWGTSRSIRVKSNTRLDKLERDISLAFIGTPFAAVTLSLQILLNLPKNDRFKSNYLTYLSMPCLDTIKHKKVKK